MIDIDLRDIAAFALVARLRNFRRAARELGVSASSLSQRLRDLEERLGVRLLNRTTRSVAVTEAGEQLLGRIAPAVQDVAAALAETRSRQGRPAGRLRINAPAPAIQLTLAPMIAPFLKRYPDINLEIIAEPALIDIVAEGYDAGVRYEESLAQDMIAMSLGPPQRYAVVASPDFLRINGIPTTPEHLVGRPGIVTRFPSRATLPWEFEKDGRVVRVTPQERLAAMNMDLQIQAAVEGLGFLATFEGFARREIEAGRLVSVLEDWLPPFPGPYIYYPSRHQPPPALAAFLAFVRERRKESESSR